MNDNPIGFSKECIETIASLSQTVQEMIVTQKSILNNISTVNSNYDRIQHTADNLTRDIKQENEDLKIMITQLNVTIDKYDQDSINQEPISDNVNLWKNPKLTQKNK